MMCQHKNTVVLSRPSAQIANLVPELWCRECGAVRWGNGQWNIPMLAEVVAARHPEFWEQVQAEMKVLWGGG